MHSTDRTNARNNAFQQSFKAENIRKRREKGIVELRKQRRVDHIIKKRALQSAAGQTAAEVDELPSDSIVFEADWVPAWLAQQLPSLVDASADTSQRFGLLVQAIAEASEEVLFELVSLLRRVISSETIPPLDVLFQYGVVNQLIVLLKSDNLKFQLEAIWCVINITSGPPVYGQALIEMGILDLVIGLLEHDSTELVEQAAWTLGNLAGDSVHNRDLILAGGAAGKLMQVLAHRPEMTLSQQGICVWTLSNLMRGKPAPPPAVVDAVLQSLPQYTALNCEEIRSDCLWILSYVSDGDTAGIVSVINTGLVPWVLTMCEVHSQKLQIPALRTLGNLVTGSDQQTDYVLSLGLLDKISPLLYSNSRAMRKEVFWTLSNVLAGSAEQVELVTNHGCAALIIQALADPDFEIKKEAVWAMANITGAANNPKLALKVLELGAFEPLCKVLDHQDPKILFVALEAINNTLRAGRDYLAPAKASSVNEVAVRFDDIGGLAKLELLQSHPNNKIYEKVVSIMEEHYGIDEVQDENVANLPEFNIA